MTRRTRRIAAALLITAATVLTVQADTAGAGVSCSLRVVDRTADTMSLRYDPHDDVSRTVWVDGQPTTIAPHTTAVVPVVEQFEYVNRGDWLVTADISAPNCGLEVPTTTTTSTTTSTVPTTTTSTSALTTITVVRITPEPTTSTAPLPPATWTVVEPTTTTVQRSTPPTLPETGPARAGDIVTVALWLVLVGLLVVLATRQRD